MGSSEGGRSPASVSMAEIVRRWRLPEFAGLVLVVLVVLLIEAACSENEQFVPANNAEGVNGYPIRLGSEWCTASDLSSCQTQQRQSACCREMEAGQGAGETVTSFLLWLVYFGVPLTFIAVRQALTACGVYKGVGTCADVLLGLFFCLGLCVTLTDGIKKGVGRPRPNFSALQALVEYGGSSMSGFKGESVRSFPSGHSSNSMAGTLYVTLVCWGDMSRNGAARRGWRRSLFAYLSIAPALLAIYVGVTRVSDYWHFQDDVVAGWAIGAACAAVAVRWVAFPEAFWRGGSGGSMDEHFGLGHSSLRSLHSLQQTGALTLMMGSRPRGGSGDGDGSEHDSDGEVVVDAESGGALVSDENAVVPLVSVV